VILTTRVDSEFSGHMRAGLSYLVKAYENDGQGVARDVEYLEEAMSGMGTKDERLYVHHSPFEG
jgi:annexin A7/11